MMATLGQILNGQLQLGELVRRAQSGDRDAFGDLFERFERQVFATALRQLGDYGEAQELCQEVFVKALTKIAQLREPECIGGWLRSITRRMAINRIVRKAPTVAVEPGSLESKCTETRTPLANVLDNERNDQLHAGLNRLRDLDRETLVAFYMRGQSLIEMSDQFDAPVGTIKRRLHVARKRLSKEVEQLVPA